MALEPEVDTFVIYDIEDDRIRNRIAEACKDYGLERVQYSAFFGSLSRRKREELFIRLADEMSKQPGKVWVQPVCQKDLRDGQRCEIAPAEGRCGNSPRGE